ncbi:PAS domain-containing protein [Geomonas paludis]|uniref:PAS domain-containing protein n=1 Tax=Geomonas paludis TaxID=2740185 RepID=A0A6V8MW81_9BACT|nr:ATP-binding protein [Geomonas paludis]UPU34458.1 PAS domain-containing protein [Geomonas paludis]GFO64446.1 hypothetical protein GMPD_23650 [Geomonas paludis]
MPTECLLDQEKDYTAVDNTSVQHLLTLTRHMPAAIFQYRIFSDGSKEITYASPSIQDIFGVSPGEVKADATALFTYLHEEDRQVVLSSIDHCSRSGLPWSREFRIAIPNQKPRWVEADAQVQVCEDHVIWHCLARDINERMVLENELREAQDCLMVLVEERTEKLTKANKKLARLNQEVQAEIQERIVLERKLKDSYDLLSQLTADLVQSEERERRRIAVELHDNVVQHLALGKLKLDMSQEEGGLQTEQLQVLSDLIVSAMHQIRRACNDLSPPLLYDLGVVQAIESLGERLAREHHFHFELSSNMSKMKTSEQLRTVLYQTASELLINAVKHAKAKNIKVRLHARQNQLRLSVLDDGIGFPACYSKGFGLAHINQRIECFKGNLSVRSKPGKTAVAVILPLETQ